MFQTGVSAEVQFRSALLSWQDEAAWTCLILRETVRK